VAADPASKHQSIHINYNTELNVQSQVLCAEIAWRAERQNALDSRIHLPGQHDDERFCRMWELYLVGSETAFPHLNQAAFQVQLAKPQDAVPLTRSYGLDGE
jgi:cyclopropane fatty-acyl-phospholipid synthase-like methyltransferase